MSSFVATGIVVVEICFQFVKGLQVTLSLKGYVTLWVEALMVTRHLAMFVSHRSTESVHITLNLSCNVSRLHV